MTADMTSEKAKALELALGQIDRQFGAGAIIRLGDVSRQSRHNVGLAMLIIKERSDCRGESFLENISLVFFLLVIAA